MNKKYILQNVKSEKYVKNTSTLLKTYETDFISEAKIISKKIDIKRYTLLGKYIPIECCIGDEKNDRRFKRTYNRRTEKRKKEYKTKDN